MSVPITENELTHQSKIIKPEELRFLDIYPHLKANIANHNKNCKEPINEFSYYCFTCKVSVCSECGIYDHNEHLLIQRENCLKYDQTFFIEIGKVIDEALLIQSKKSIVKAEIINSVSLLQAKLEEIKQIKLDEVDEIFKEITQSLIELKQNFDLVKESIETYYKSHDKFFGIGLNNIDQENTVFLMNFEIMNLCDNKNLEVLESINRIKDNIDHYNKSVKDRTDSLVGQLEHYLDLDSAFEKFDDFYWDVKLRTKKYTENIRMFQHSVFEIAKSQGTFEKLQDLVEIMDSKHKKGVELIFNQDYFLMQETIQEEGTQRKMKVRGNSKVKLLTQTKSGNISAHKSKSSSNIQTNGTASPNKTHTNFNLFNRIFSPDDIRLDSRIIQRFFAYSIFDVYGKLFAQQKTANLISARNIMSKFAARYNQLKEYAKPIIGTNEIAIYNKKSNLLTRIHIALDKDIHGYTVFPDGCRHILVENDLYITGGVDYIKSPINVVLCYNVKNNTLERLSSLIYSHSYHTIEFLENYDCLIIIGGEMNKTCELFDLCTKRWTKFPDLNYPRSNVNIYYDQISSDIYALFGMKDSIVDHGNNSDIIEVLEMKDINSGWFKVDYYKTADLNFKLNYCAVMPFTKDTLLIYGGNKARSQKKLFALYHLAKNEVMKVDEKQIEQIKAEEKKIRTVDQAIERLKTIA